MKRYFQQFLLLSLSLLLGTSLLAHRPDIGSERPDGESANNGATTSNPSINFREDCADPLAQRDMAINNVRARLTTGGDVWWNGDDGRYIVPKVPAGLPEVSSIFAGAVWLGGFDDGGSLKLAAQTYGRPDGDFDFYPGPLDPATGQTDADVCAKWDVFFRVTAEEIDEHNRLFEEAQRLGLPYDPDLIPRGVKGWPAKGNEFFDEINGFQLPNTTQGLAGFFDRDNDGEYNPDLGDFPRIEIRGCEPPNFPPQFGDEMFFWIYNDAGNNHDQTNAEKIQMEVQVQAFAYATNDEINDMTFQRYKLINRAIEPIDSTFFAMWVDPDLGCYTDDYIGCDTSLNLAYVYNEDLLDGTTACVCDQGVNTYCSEVPILGIDYFRGPLDENGQEIGMSSFTYFNNGSVGTPPQGTTDPETAVEYYNYLSGSWRDGSPFTYGGDGYQDGDPINYAFTEAPNDPNGWSMCAEDLPYGDRRTIQASGPFRLDPGAVNELIIGAVWVADQVYPCPSIRKLIEADEVAQNLFDNCFDIVDGPDAPDVDWIELDQKIIAVLTNDEETSNNAFEGYSEKGLNIPADAEDSLYVFEGYQLYQLIGPDVTLADLKDTDKSRVVAQVDVNNGTTRIFNWSSVAEDEVPAGIDIKESSLQVDGGDLGVRHTFEITEDQFAEGDRRLINHKKYYYVAVAYAHNEYLPYDPFTDVGQDQPYLEGRDNIGDGVNPFYTVIPRPITYETLNAEYGEGVVITRIDGKGNNGISLDINEETRAAILDGSFNGEITYKPGAGPVEIQIFNPLEVVDGDYELRVVDQDMSDDAVAVNATWELRNLSNPGSPILSDQTIEKLNEQIIKEYGFSVTIGQTPDAGPEVISYSDKESELRDRTNGFISYEEEYVDANQVPFLRVIPDGYRPGIGFFDDFAFEFLQTEQGQVDDFLDPNKNYSASPFVPYMLSNYVDQAPVFGAPPPFITQAFMFNNNSLARNDRNPLSNLNNVDIVLTPDKSQWTQCIIVETANPFMLAGGFQTVGGTEQFDLRESPSVTKYDMDGDGNPDVDPSPIADGTTGIGWFPGYAIDVETGNRLMLFFGENTLYNGSALFQDDPNTSDVNEEALLYEGGRPNGADMLFNPNSQDALGIVTAQPTIIDYFVGGQHMVYVTRRPYNEAGVSYYASRMKGDPPLRKLAVLREVTWAGIVALQPGTSFESLGSGETGLIPSEVRIKLRVDNPYQVETYDPEFDESVSSDQMITGTGVNNFHPAYLFSIKGKEAQELANDTEVNEALDAINVVPNPYYGFSDYEISQFTNTIKITNLPAKCTVTIYSLDGKFIRRLTRDETGAVPTGGNRGINRAQILPDLEWDLRNQANIPIASGVYLIHVDAPGMGERTLKWFGVNRQFDPSGL